MQHVSRRVCKNDMTSDRLQTPNSNVKRCALKTFNYHKNLGITWNGTSYHLNLYQLVKKT